MAIPAFRAIRANFNSAQITLLSDKQSDGTIVPAAAVLDGENLVDDYLDYSPPRQIPGALNKYFNLLKLMGILRAAQYDTLVYLLQNRANRVSIIRDLMFFKLAGIRRFIGTSDFQLLMSNSNANNHQSISHQTDLFLKRLELSGLSVPSTYNSSFCVNIRQDHKEAVNNWMSKQAPVGNRRLIAIGPGSKMPAKRWPIERFEQVASRLISVYDVWPVIFGGPEDQALGKDLITKWSRGWLAAGHLGVREGIAAMQRCSFYLGNDTGTMHMAVAAGIPCVAIFSSRDLPGRWYPYGYGHAVFHTNIECGGCMLQECIENRMKCILSIDVDNVCNAAEQMLLKVRGGSYGDG